MKSLIISNSLWNIYNFRFRLISELSKKNDVVVYCNIKKTDKFLKKFPKKVKIKNLQYSSKSKNIFKNLKLIFFFFKILIKEKPNNLFTFTLKPNLYFGILNNFFKINFFPTITGLGTAKNRGGLLLLFIKLLMKFSFKSSSKIIVHNKNEKKFLINIGFNKNKIIQTNGSGISLSKYKNNSFNSNISNKYLFVGRLIADKGINELVVAFKKFNKFVNKTSQLTLAIMPDEDNQTSIKVDDIKFKTSNTNIVLKINTKNISKVIKDHGCLILPSYSEGMSRSIMEAITSSRPVICSNIHGCKEMVINNFNGFLVTPKSSQSIYQALKKFNFLTLRDKKKLGRNSRYLAKKNRFDEKYVVSEYINLIKQ